MKSKVLNIKGNNLCNQVLITLSRDTESGKDYIELSAWHKHPQDGDFYQMETIESDDRDLLIGIINNFTEIQALNWSNSFAF